MPAAGGHPSSRRRAPRTPRAARRLASLALAGGLLLGVDPSWGDEAADPAGSKGPVPLDQLLILPDGHQDFTVEKRAGMTRAEWRQAFADLRQALDHERTELAKAEIELDDEASSTDNWQVGPSLPGIGGPSSDAPMNYELKQRMTRLRDEIERLEKQLKQLEIEANLAEVPDDWRS